MENIVHDIGTSPLLAFLGAALLVALLLVPVVLRLAGLSGSQIVDVLLTWARLLPEMVRAWRDGDENR